MLPPEEKYINLSWRMDRIQEIFWSISSDVAHELLHDRSRTEPFVSGTRMVPLAVVVEEDFIITTKLRTTPKQADLTIAMGLDFYMSPVIKRFVLFELVVSGCG
ncbi:hypothetical protein RUM44_000208 [Polyplax serrata]|uniref:Uncharacterized protein n=1 Tax=Polyplax serrata TaxID=468196 RepID=A0ABR1B4S7_POLSC